MGFRVEVDGIATREIADALVGELNPYTASAAGMTIRILDTLDVHEPDEFPTREAP